MIRLLPPLGFSRLLFQFTNKNQRTFLKDNNSEKTIFQNKIKNVFSDNHMRNHMPNFFAVD